MFPGIPSPAAENWEGDRQVSSRRPHISEQTDRKAQTSDRLWGRQRTQEQDLTAKDILEETSGVSSEQTMDARLHQNRAKGRRRKAPHTSESVREALSCHPVSPPGPLTCALGSPPLSSSAPLQSLPHFLQEPPSPCPLIGFPECPAPCKLLPLVKHAPASRAGCRPCWAKLSAPQPCTGS